jgi:hypothetical protein
MSSESAFGVSRGMRRALAALMLICWYWFMERDRCTQWHDEQRLVSYRVTRNRSERRPQTVRVCDIWDRRGYWR